MCGGFIEDVFDTVFDVIEDVGDVVFDVVDSVVEVVEDVGRDFDDFVRDVIPGGWGGVAGLGLLAVGIANPTLLGLAEGGALTGEAIAAAGLDAAAVAEAVATVAPEVLAATEVAVASGIAPEVIAMANATLDPIAALSAAQGWTIADTAYLASIGAPEALIATATANNAALATAGETAAGGAVETGVSTATDGSTTQIFDDGSTLTTAADGTVTSTPATDTGLATGGNTQVFDDGSTLTTNPDGTVTSTPATDTGLLPTDGLPPVEDLSGTGVPGTNNPYGNADIPLDTALGNYASAVYDTLGPLGTAAVLGGGAALLGGFEGAPSGSGYAGASPYEWGTAQPLVNPGLNPGYLGYAASLPDYQTTNPTDAQYYWGVNAPVNSEQDLANYNKLPAGAPTTPWGAGKTAVGGQLPLNVPNFINQYITNPALTGVMSGTGAGFAPTAPVLQPAVMPPATTVQPAVMPPMSMAQQAMSNMGGRSIPSAMIEQPMITGPAVPALV